MAFHLAAISLRQILRLLLLRCRSSRSKDLELLVLRQELDVLHRQVPRPRFRLEERWVLTALQRLRPVRERLSSLVTPDTIRRWHSDLVRAKWRTVIGSCRVGGSPIMSDFWSGVWPARTRPGATAA
jgi:putative transposase